MMLSFEWQPLYYDGRVQSLMAEGPPDIFLSGCGHIRLLGLKITLVRRLSVTILHWTDRVERNMEMLAKVSDIFAA
jgi:hypothetical protein